MIDAQAFTQSFDALFAEAFGVLDTPHGFFLDSGSAGLLGTIDTLDAATASMAVKPGQETIAAHCGHVLALLDFFAAYERGENPQMDWPGSWRTRNVDPAAWDSLRAELRAAYQHVAALMQAHTDWSQPAVGACMMLLAHCSYHVGVIHKLRTSL